MKHFQTPESQHTPKKITPDLFDLTVELMIGRFAEVFKNKCFEGRKIYDFHEKKFISLKDLTRRYGHIKQDKRSIVWRWRHHADLKRFYGQTYLPWRPHEIEQDGIPVLNTWVEPADISDSTGNTKIFWKWLKEFLPEANDRSYLTGWLSHKLSNPHAPMLACLIVGNRPAYETLQQVIAELIGEQNTVTVGTKRYPHTCYRVRKAMEKNWFVFSYSDFDITTRQGRNKCAELLWTVRRSKGGWDGENGAPLIHIPTMRHLLVSSRDPCMVSMLTRQKHCPSHGRMQEWLQKPANLKALHSELCTKLKFKRGSVYISGDGTPEAGRLYENIRGAIRNPEVSTAKLASVD